MKARERGQSLGELAEAESGVAIRFVGLGKVILNVINLVVEQGGFDDPSALEMRAGDGDLLDDEIFGCWWRARARR